MFMHILIEDLILPSPSGIQRARLACGRILELELAASEQVLPLPREPAQHVLNASTCWILLRLLLIAAGKLRARASLSALLIVLVHVVLACPCDHPIERQRPPAPRLRCAACAERRCFPDAVGSVASTVRALYAGTLVGAQTTAPRPQPSCRNSCPRQSQRAILLAALLLVLATVTIAARCHVSASTPAALVPLVPLVQFNPHSPIQRQQHDSTSPLQTSSIVLSSLLATPRANNLPSDISIIDTPYSKLYAGERIAARTRRRRTVPTFRTLTTWSSNHTLPDKQRALPRDNVYSAPPSPRTIAHKQAAIPRLRGTASKTFASPPNNSAIDNRSGAPAHEDALEGADYNATHTLPPADKRPMPPEHVYTKDLLNEGGGLLVLVAACLVLTLALGLVTCVLSHYRGGILAGSPDGAQTPTTAPMLSVVSAGATAGVGGMDRLRGRGAARDLTATRDHQVRLHTVHTDIAINLPPSISLPDGEEHPFSSRLHLRDTEQESEIYQKCIRPPPNRTALESESPPPYRSSSAGLLGSIGGGSSFGSSTDWSGGSAPLVVRCHSMSASSVASTKRPDAAGSSSPKTDFIQKTVKILTGKKSQPSPAPTLPPVIVPTRTRRTPDQHPHLNHNHHCPPPPQPPQQHPPEQQQHNAPSGCPNSNV